ncbi:MAG: hypothetical protein IT314_11925 [Anaerolineales bacterium]|nr:hypothetical protein [Anaerolineales bacterium]
MNQDSNEPIIQPQHEGGGSKWLTRKEYTDPAEKKKDFWIGVALFFVLNVVLTLCQWGLGYGVTSAAPDLNASSTLGTILMWVFLLLPWAINIGLIIYFAFTRSQIALGMVAGFGIALFLVICAGVIFTIWCFAALSSSGY